MTHTYRVHYFHLIWSTKNRLKLITESIQNRLYEYLGGIIRKHGGLLIEIGGMEDHIHLLIELSNLDPFSKIIRDMKACSSLWIHKEFPDLPDFAWQEGYASFSVSYSQLESVKTYIRNQESHHTSNTFEHEYLKFLEKHNIQGDKRFVLG